MSKNPKFTIVQLYQFAYDYLTNNKWEYQYIQKALKESNGDIEKAIEICQSIGGFGSWGGMTGPGYPDIESQLDTKKGYLKIWNDIPVDDPQKKPDLYLTIEEVFKLVRDGIQAQLTLF